jgi:hypothetical protein
MTFLTLFILLTVITILVVEVFSRRFIEMALKDLNVFLLVLKVVRCKDQLPF